MTQSAPTAQHMVTSYAPTAKVGSVGQRLDPALNSNYRTSAPGVSARAAMPSMPNGLCWLCGDPYHMRTDPQGNVTCEHYLDLLRKGDLVVGPKGAPMWPNGGYTPRYNGVDTPLVLIKRIIEARTGVTAPSAAVQTIQSTVIYESCDTTEESSSGEENLVPAAVNAARTDKWQEKTTTTRAGRTTRAPRRNLTAPTTDSQRVLKARKDRRAEDVPVMKGIQEGTYDEDDDLVPTQGTIRAEIVEDDMEMQDAPAKKPKAPTTSVRNQLKNARKQGDPREEAVVDSMLDSMAPVSFRTFLTYAPAIEKRFFGRFRVQNDEDSVIPSAGLNRLGLARHIVAERDSEESFLTADTPKVTVTIRGNEKKGTMTALIDSGAELSVISKKEAFMLGLPITHDYQLQISGAIGQSAKVWGCCENVVMAINGKPFVTNIWVMEGLTNPLILGNPFAISSNMKVSWSKDGSCRIKLTDCQGSRMLMGAVAADSDLNRMPEDLLREAKDLLHLKE
jgi:hypothetical protein